MFACARTMWTIHEPFICPLFSDAARLQKSLSGAEIVGLWKIKFVLGNSRAVFFSTTQGFSQCISFYMMELLVDLNFLKFSYLISQHIL